MAKLFIPGATYRLQLNSQLRFENARNLVPTLHELGITDLYASPILQARRGSLHGYDVTDPTRLNSEIGNEEDLETLVHELQRCRMGLLLDIVPNHMAASIENPWWADVLENGPASSYAGYFDIDWHPPVKTLENKVLLPLLVRRFAEVLENQELTLFFEEHGFFIRYGATQLPIAPKSYIRIIGYRLDQLKQGIGADSLAFGELQGILAALEELPPRVALPSEAAGDRRLGEEAIKDRLWQLYNTSPEIHSFIDNNLRTFNGKKRNAGSFTHLDELLGEQAYVLAFWQTANEEINYRRFFTISDLVGVRVEDPLVFNATHTAILRLVERGAVTGLRIDHIDGLRDPTGYLRRLQERLAPEHAKTQRPAFYVIVEKILGRDELLPESWPSFGTTGYDFLNALNRLFVDACGHRALIGHYGRMIRNALSYNDLVYEKKKQVMETYLAVEMRALGHHLSMLAEQDRYARDLPAADLARGLIEVTAFLPIYRTYIRNFDVTPLERRYIEQAVEASRRRNPQINPGCFDFLRDVLALKNRTHLSSSQKEAHLSFVMRWQQFSGPIMAKGFEDTVLYIYNPLTSLNEVGGDPAFAGSSVAGFHEFCRLRKVHWPHALNATTTHDTKRSEDVRARINVLSEMPSEWKRRLELWMRFNKAKKTAVNGQWVPDPSEEILVYQTMLGAWPFQETEVPEFKGRLKAYLIKAAREAKVHTTWSHPDVKHERALLQFVESVLEGSQSNRFLADFLQLQEKISFYGAVNALGQVAAKITAPGVPDFYQGSELWDLRLVDPDIRTPVDFEKRVRLFQSLRWEEGQDQEAFTRGLLESWRDGRIKLYLISRMLNFRRTHRRLFEKGDYIPLTVIGKHSENVCAFFRHQAKEWALTAIPRLVSRLTPTGTQPVGHSVWGATALLLDASLPRLPHSWKNILTGEILTTTTVRRQAVLPVASVLAQFPVALLENA